MQTTWRKLNKDLGLLDEEQVRAMLDEERAGAKRISILKRLHQRYAALRTERERLEILREAQAL